MTIRYRIIFFLLLFLSQISFGSNLDTIKKQNIIYKSYPRNAILENVYKESFKLKAQNKINQEEIEQKNLLIIITLIFSSAILFISFLVYKRGIKSLRMNKILAEKNIEIIRQRQELEDLNNLKTKFFSIISHDLREPLLSLKGVLNLLDDDLLDKKEAKSMIKQLNVQFNVTSNLMDNLLIWAKAQMQGEKLNKGGFNLYDLVNENINLQRTNVIQKQISIDNMLPRDLEIYADKEMIKVVIRNLINNALKFTPAKGNITVNYKLDQRKVKICISDTGIGLSKQELQQIFKRNFFSKTGLNEEKGTGLGLILCQEFIKKNNGTFDVESKKEEGSTFFFTLPLFKQNAAIAN